MKYAAHMVRAALVVLLVAACGPAVSPYGIRSTPAGRDQWMITVSWNEDEEGTKGVALAKSYERAGIDCPAGYDILSEKRDEEEVGEDIVAVMLVVRCKINKYGPTSGK